MEAHQHSISSYWDCLFEWQNWCVGEMTTILSCANQFSIYVFLFLYLSFKLSIMKFLWSHGIYLLNIGGFSLLSHIYVYWLSGFISICLGIWAYTLYSSEYVFLLNCYHYQKVSLMLSESNWPELTNMPWFSTQRLLYPLQKAVSNGLFPSFHIYWSLCCNTMWCQNIWRVIRKWITGNINIQEM